MRPGLAIAMLAIAIAGCSPQTQPPGPWREQYGLESSEALGLTPGEEATLEGVVVENTIDPCVIDDHPDPCDVGGPQFLRLDVDGAASSVTYSYGEDEECLSWESRHGGQARSGTGVEVFGLVTGEGEFSGTIDTCAAEDYYIEVLD
jgi:hypothetical protein